MGDSVQQSGSLVSAIEHRVDLYLENLPGTGDQRLEQFEILTLRTLDRYRPAKWHERASLNFADLYQWQQTRTQEGPLRGLLIALLAAEVEFRGPVRLSHAQNRTLAEVFTRIGAECQANELLLHAQLAYDRAASLYLVLGEDATRDARLYDRTRIFHQAQAPGWPKRRLWLAWVLCGYGHRPYWLLLWVVAQLVVFSVGLSVVLPGPLWDRVDIALSNYLNPYNGLETSPLADVLLLIESYLGLVSVSVFFALLVKRWFRS